MTEASAIEKYAVENNLIDPKHIIKEEQASSTAENSYYSRIIIDQFGASNVHVVTTQLHMERAKKFFERVCSCGLLCYGRHYGKAAMYSQNIGS